MTLGVRKLTVLVQLAAIFLPANVRLLVHWLGTVGVIDLAGHVRSEYLTGTAIPIILVLPVLPVRPRSNGAKLLRRCPICDHLLLGRAKYRGECGSGCEGLASEPKERSSLRQGTGQGQRLLRALAFSRTCRRLSRQPEGRFGRQNAGAGGTRRTPITCYVSGNYEN